MEQQWCGKQQLTLHSQNVQHLDQSDMKPRKLWKISSHTLFSSCGAPKCMEIRAAKKKLSIVKVHGSLMCPIFLYRVLFHSMRILKQS